MDLLFVALIILGGGGGLYAAWRAFGQARAMRAQLGEARDKAEALFRSGFPELQPNFHPRQILALAQAWVKNKGMSGAQWRDPPGFPGNTLRRVAGGTDELELLNEAGERYATLRVQPNDEGLALRLGAGKFTADLRDAVNPRVRYWHPDRQFKWSEAKGWQFVTPLAEHPIAHEDERLSYVSDRGHSWSQSGGESASPSFSGAGGEFGGAGASASWDEAGSSSASDSAGASAAASGGSTAY